MRNCGQSLFVFLLLFALLASNVQGAEPSIPPPQGFVSDFANILSSATRRQLTELLQELKEKTSAEIAVVTVETTQPLTTFDYAMKIAEAWKPGQKGKTTASSSWLR